MNIAILKLLRTNPSFKVMSQKIYQLLGANQNIEDVDFVDFFKNFCPALLLEIEKKQKDLIAVAERVQQDLSRGYKYCVFGSSNYPSGFYQMDSAPLYFMYWGHANWLSKKNLAVVGSREPSELTRVWLERELSLMLEQYPVNIISGGARGVDQLSHRICVRKKLATTVIIPSGLSQIYPYSIREWTHSIIDNGGCFVSEYDSYEVMKKFHFADRNRLIAGLSDVILIAEAKEKSGTMITANHAATLDRPVLIVPSHPLDGRFTGSLSLLLDGGTMIRNAEDLRIICESEMKFAQSQEAGRSLMF